MLNGSAENRVDLVFVAEGYTEAEQEQFINQSGSFAAKLLTIVPFSWYRSYFNVYAVSVASKESGSDHPSQGIFRDTYFNSSYDTFGGSLTVPPNDLDPDSGHGWSRAHGLLTQLLPGWDVAVIVVNDSVPSGWGDRNGAVISINSILGNTIMAHELGHAFGGLGDEYETPFPYDPEPGVEEPNITRETRRGFIKWKAWISEQTPVPTPESDEYANQVGLFEGARYFTKGWYRPKLGCLMRMQGSPLFCEVCREQLILRIYRCASPIESVSPAVRRVAVRGGEQIELHVEPKKPENHDLTVRWFLDGAQTDETSGYMILKISELERREHEVRVEVVDATDKVRLDPEGLLSDSYTWFLGPHSDRGKRREHRNVGTF